MAITPVNPQLPQSPRPAPIVRGFPGQQQAQGLSPKDFLRTLLKHIYLVTLLPLGMTALSILITVLWLKMSPLFTAKAYVQVLPPQPSALVNTTQSQASREIMERLASSMASMIRTEQVMTLAMKKPEMTRTGYYNLNIANAGQRLLKDVDVGPVGGTDIIAISMTGASKKDVTDIVNAVAQAAVDDDAKRVERLYGVNKETLQRNLEEARAKRQKVRDDKKDLTKDLGILEDRHQALSTEISRIEAIIDQLQMEERILQANLNDLKSKDMTSLQAVQIQLDNDPMLRSLKLAKANTETELQRAEQKYGPQSRQYQSIRASLESLEKQIEEITATVTATALEQMKVTLEGQIAGKAEARNYEQNQKTLRNVNLQDLSKRIQDIAEATQLENSLNATITQTENRLAEIGALNPNRLLFIRQAEVPTEASFPKWSIMVPLGVALGLTLGFGLAFLLEFMDSSVKSSTDITRRVDLPVLGMIPHLDDLEDDVPDIRLAFMTNPNSLVGESFRQIRTNLLFSGPATRLKSLLITSPMPEDGRTTITINLAGSMARAGRKVLVIDANFRQPAMRKLFPQCKDAGLSNALVGQSAWQELVVQIEPNLWVLPSGPLPPNPAELLGSEQMQQIVKQMSAEYDQVLFDAAPGLVVTDSAVLATVTDGVVLVVRASVNTYGVVTRTRDMMQKVGGHVIGVVLNGVRATAGGYLRKSYETFYDYHEQAQLPGKV